MGDAGPAAGEQVDLGPVQFDAMGVPDVVPGPAQILGILARTAAEHPFGISDILVVFGQMGVKHHALVAGKEGRVAHQLPAHRKGEQGATPTRIIDPSEAS